MTSSLLLGARTVRLFGTGLVMAGVLLLAYFVALVCWQFGAARNEVLGAALQFVDQALLQPGVVAPLVGLWPQIPPAWLTSMHVAMAGSVLGIALSTLGLLISRWQAARIAEAKRRVQDRMRRVQVYRESSRTEPFIGPGNIAGVDDEKHSAPRRRVA